MLKHFSLSPLLCILLLAVLDAKASTADTIPPPPVFKIDTLVKISYGSCYGSCPQYDMTIFNDGTMIWNGYKNILPSGLHIAKLSRSQLLEIEKSVANETVWSGSDVFPKSKAFIPDFPNRKLIIKNKDRVKNILINHSPSVDLRNLEEKLRGLSESAEWHPISN